MAETISAAAAVKPKRGRPRRWPADFEMLSKFMVGEGKSPRHLRDMAYLNRAMFALRDDSDRFGWLFPPTGRWRRSLLAELGRIDDPEEMAAVADMICEHKPTTKKAIKIIRRARLGREPSASMEELAVALVQTVQNYTADHPGLTGNAIGKAFDIARQVAAAAE
jgi:hypothetical protein